MLFRLLLAMIIVPLVELYLLLRLADATSVFATVAIVIGTGILGSFLARREGLNAWVRFQRALGEGRAPSKEIQDGLMIVFAAALLLTPGLLTDAFGFLLLLPPSRALIRKFVLARFFKGMKVQVGAGVAPDGPFRSPNVNNDPNTIDAKAVHRTSDVN